MRLYAITSFYCVGIQAGIQAGHLAHELLYTWMSRADSPERQVAVEWARNHKTMIVLAGGEHANQVSLSDTLYRLGDALELPTESFFEPGMNGMLTSTGIIVPEHIYSLPHVLDEEQIGKLSEDEFALHQILKSFSLAK